MGRVGIVVALSLGACRPSAPAPSPAPSPAPAPAPPPAPAPAPPPDVATDWCLDGLSGLDEQTCYVLPPLAEGAPRRLLVYLHGLVPPRPESEQKATVELAVLHAARRAGAAALVPRGRRGIGPGHAHEWWAWPTSRGSYAKLAEPMVRRIEQAKEKLEAIAGAPFERTYLAGSSNGAYFVAALALSGDLDDFGLDVDGFGFFSGGALGGRNIEGPARPAYVGFGSYDTSTNESAPRLARALDAAGWPVKLAEHAVGHGAREVYLDEAFAFWARAPTSKLPRSAETR